MLELQIVNGIIEDQRRPSRNDRRTRHRPLNIHAIRGRRKSPRRALDQDALHHAHSDHHDGHIFWATLAILLLCIFDAHYTLLIINLGGEELNHFMDALIQQGMLAFVVGKYTLTAFSLVILAAHSRFHMFDTIKVHHIIYGFLLLYGLLVAYELYIWPAPLSNITGF